MRKMLIVVALVALLTGVLVAPAAAGGGHHSHARHADIDLELYAVPCSESDARLLTWAGTADFGKKTLGIAYFPTAPLKDLGDGWVYFEEDWTLFWLPRGEMTDAKMIAAACNPRREVLRGEDAGIGTPWGTALATGHVTWARAWWQKFVGGETFFSGAYTSEAGDMFAGTLWLVPGNMR